MKKKKLIWSVIVVLLLFIGVYGYYSIHKTKEGDSHFIIGKVKLGEITRVINATGTITPINYVDVSTNLPGQLSRVLVHENEEVKKGQIIAYIDDSSLQDNLRALKATLDNRYSNYKRYETLYHNGAVATSAYDDAKTAYLTAQANYDKAAKLAADATIIAPMTGTIVGTPLQPGQTISTGLSNQMVICTIADLSNLEISLAVDETDISSVKMGQRVDFTVDSFPGKIFHGQVSTVSKGKKGSFGTVSTNVVFYIVKITIKGDEEKGLLPSMTARASIYCNPVKHILVVPITAIRSDQKGQFVYVLKDGKPVRQTVKTGITGDNEVQILAGLEEGQAIIVSGYVDEKSKTGTRRRGLF